MDIRILRIVIVMMISMAAGHASAIERLYGVQGSAGSGVVTYTQTDTDELTIVFNNTSDNIDFSGFLNSSVITGLVFNVAEDINALNVVSFTSDGNSVDTDLLSYYDVELNVNNNITPGNTKVDLSITTTNGINGGIYNEEEPGSDLNNVFPDLATLVLTITDPVNPDWNLVSISEDVLRMQRVGPNGKGSLKLPGYDDGEEPPAAIPEPSILALFGLGLMCAGLARMRRRQG